MENTDDASAGAAAALLDLCTPPLKVRRVLVCLDIVVLLAELFGMQAPASVVPSIEHH
jgi:hypothetical protein